MSTKGAILATLQKDEMFCPNCTKRMSNKRGAKCKRCGWENKGR